jgi:hypothetical protein
MVEGRPTTSRRILGALLVALGRHHAAVWKESVMRKIHSLAVMVAVAALAIAGTMAAASASTPNQINQKVNAYNYLHLFVSGTATAGWQKTADSPLDADSRALVGTLPDNNINTYVNAYSQASRHLNKPIGSIKNLSYDFQSDKTAGGDPRISVIFTNGDVAYLNAQFCAQPLAASSYTWSRADFTGSTTASSAPCSFMDSHGATYASTGTTSAWQAYATANPTLVVAQTIFVLDFPPDSGGSYAVDRISLGTGWMYHAYSNHADTCPTEAVC